MEIQDLQSADTVVDDKNTELVQTDVDNARGIRATPSGYGDRMDIDRATDTATFREGLSVKDIRDVNKAARGSKVSLKGFAKNAVIQALSSMQQKADESGQTDDQIQQAGLSLIHQGSQNTYDLANKQAAAGTQEPQFVDNFKTIRAVEQGDIQAETARQGVGFGDMVGAAFNQTTAIPALLESMNRPEFPADPTYDYSARRDKIEVGLSEEDRQFMRESRSLAEEQSRLSEVKRRMEDLNTLSAHGGYWATAASLTAGMLDPVGWGIGLGVGKGLQVVGMGSVAAFKAGNMARGIGLGAAEGTIGNVAITGLVDAAGGHVTDRDYAYAAGFGMAFGGLGALVGMRSATEAGVAERQAGATREFLKTQDETLMDAHVLMREARERAGAKVPNEEPGEEIVPSVLREVEAQKAAATEPVEVLDFEYSRKNPRRGMKQDERFTQSAREELTNIMNTHEDPVLVTQAARLLQLMGDDVRIITAKSVKRGNFDYGDHTVRVNPDDREPWVIMHEVTHALTADRLRYGAANPDTAIGALTKEINALHQMAVAAAKGREFKLHGKYYLSNIDEFNAGLYSGDKDFHDFLASVPVRGDGRSLLNALVQSVRKILGLGANEETLLTRSLGVSDELMQRPVQVNTKYWVPNKGKDGWTIENYSRFIGEEQHRAGLAVQDGAAAETVKDLNVVQERLAPNPSPEAVQRELDQLMRDRYNAAMAIVHARVSNGNKFMPSLDQTTVTSEGKVVPPKDVLLPQGERDKIGQLWGIDDALVQNVGDVQVLTEMAARATRWANDNPVDAARIDSILGKMPWLASTGLQLAKSKNPVARMVAGVLLENTTGATGRGRTAALDKNLLQRQYDEHLANAEQHYTAWRNRNNGNIASDLISGDMRDRFMREVSAEIRSRDTDAAFPHNADADVRAYADALEAGFDRMRVDQQSRNTIGSARLGEHSRGYSPRRISKKWARGATIEQRRALSREFADQLEEVWNDRPFAERIATGYVERARLEAGGGVTPPTNLYSDEASDIIKDVMRAGGVPDDQIDKLMGKFSRGGQGFTKKRLELDLDKVIRTEAGDEFNVADAFEHDQAKLYQDYARRVSGEVALANFGIYGQHGLMQLRRLIADFGPNGTPATIAEVRAFDQVAAEFYGRPLPGTGNKALGNLRLLSSMSMLGGMAFNQFAEFSNSLPLLGLGGALKQVAELPRLIKEVVRGTENKMLSSLELVGGPIGHDQRVVFPYQELDDTQVWGAGDLNAFDRVLRSGAQAMPWLSGFHYVHAAQVRGMSEQIVMKSMRFINEGKENVALDSMGFTPALRERIKAELPNIAEFAPDGSLSALDITKANDVEAMAEFVQSVHRGSKQIIQGTYIGETGAWAHNDLLRILTQFRTFSITSMEKQWSRQRADMGTIKAMGLLLGSMAFAAPIQLARIQVNAAGREDGDEYIAKQMAPALFARNLLNYSSISGVLGDVIDSSAALTGNNLSGGRSGAQKSAADAIPAVGYINNLVDAVQQRDPRELIRSLPGQNLPFLVPLVNFTD